MTSRQSGHRRSRPWNGFGRRSETRMYRIQTSVGLTSTTLSRSTGSRALRSCRRLRCGNRHRHSDVSASADSRCCRESKPQIPHDENCSAPPFPCGWMCFGTVIAEEDFGEGVVDAFDVFRVVRTCRACPNREHRRFLLFMP